MGEKCRMPLRPRKGLEEDREDNLGCSAQDAGVERQAILVIEGLEAAVEREVGMQGALPVFQSSCPRLSVRV
eukprot:scaffold9367_cov37-Tisochrysis_lutea.AAC.2